MLHMRATPFVYAFVLVGAGIAFGVGYGVQDFLSAFGPATTVMSLKVKSSYVRRLYQRLDPDTWEYIKPETQEAEAAKKAQNAFDSIIANPSHPFKAELQRIENLMVVGAALGSCALVLGVLLGLRLLPRACHCFRSLKTFWGCLYSGCCPNRNS